MISKNTLTLWDIAHCEKGILFCWGGDWTKTSRPHRAGLRLASGVAEDFARRWTDCSPASGGPGQSARPARRRRSAMRWSSGRRGPAAATADRPSHDRRSGPPPVTQRAGAEPQPHHLAAHSLRRQQSHGRQPNRAEAQFTERQHQDAAHQPQRRHTGPAVAQNVLRRQHHQAKARRCAQDANHEFGHTARTNVLRASAGHAS